MAKKPTPFLFINYRLADVEDPAGRLKDALDHALEPGQVFIDCQGIDGGDDWAVKITAALKRSTIVFALIGDRWLTTQQEGSGVRRLDIEDDWVRTEIEYALDPKTEAQLFPVLINSAALPLKDYLPPSIQGLTAKQAVKLRHAEWKTDLTEILRQLRKAGFQFKPGEPPPSPPTDVITTYLDYLRETHSKLVPFFPEAETRLLNKVFVELSLSRDADICASKHDAEERIKKGDRGSQRLHDLIALEPTQGEGDDAITGRWIVRGDPGAGKSTIARHLCWELAGNRYGSIPVFIPLPLWATDKRSPFELAEEELRNGMGDIAANGLRAALANKAAQDGALWLIFDGLDEVAPDDLPDLRNRLSLFCTNHPLVRVVVMSRRVGMTRPSPEFCIADLLPLSPRAQRELLSNWLGASQAETLQARLATRPQLERLMSNPLLLTLLAKVAIEGEKLAQSGSSLPRNRLPRNRRELYDQAIAILLTRGFGAKPVPVKNPPSARFVLSELSLTLQESATSNWTEDELDTALWKAREQSPAVATRISVWDNDHSKYLNDISKISGVLAQHDGSRARWAFLHRQFREFLAAEALHRRAKADWIEQIKNIDDDDLPRWAETMAFACGMSDDPLAALTPLREHSAELALKILPELEGVEPAAILPFLTSTQGWDGLTLSGVVSNWDVDSEAGRDRAAELLWSMVTPRAVEELAYVHFALTQIGRRPDRERFFEHANRPIAGVPNVDFVDIPASRFLMGSPEREKERSRDEGPQRMVEVESFQMATTTITNAQYLEFDKNHSVQEWPGADSEALKHFPVVNISWWQAYLFSAWIGARLPSEAEWEYACRAGRTTPFSFGENITAIQVNYDGDYPYADGEKGEDRARPVTVGSLPANEYGLHEMHGNVWEWCQDTWHGSYDDAPALATAWEDNGSGDRVMRGGGWLSAASYCRSAYRDGSDPGWRSINFGFRPARSSLGNITTSPSNEGGDR